MRIQYTYFNQAMLEIKWQFQIVEPKYCVNTNLTTISAMLLSVHYLELSTKKKLREIFWQYFVETFDTTNPCTFHYLCPCSKCSAIPNIIILVGLWLQAGDPQCIFIVSYIPYSL